MRRSLNFAALIVFSFVAPVLSASTAALTGRVFNPLTGEYLRNAEVRVVGTDHLAVTADDGSYILSNLPVGTLQVSVTYTGYATVLATVETMPGHTVARDFDLNSTVVRKGGDIVTLDQVTVSSRREGTAKAIMEQRTALGIKNIIASDTFGDMMEGNIAEVLQYLPGLEVIYDGGDPVAFGGRGLAGKYGALTIDGVRSYGSTGARQPSLVSNSANAADTIEFNKTNSADMDADAPGGSVNLKSKSAFQRKGRFFSYQVYGLVNSYQLHLGKSDGPNDGQTPKTLPGYILDYSDIFLQGRLGVVLNVNEANSSNEQSLFTLTYNTAATAASPAPVVLTGVSYVSAPKVNRRQSGGLNLEYKLTPAVTLALRSQYNIEDARIYNRQLNFVSTRASMDPASNELRMIANATATTATRVSIAGSTTLRSLSNHTFSPTITYVGRRMAVDATFSYMRAGRYYRNGRMDNSASFNQANMQLNGIGFTLSRASIDAARFDFRQTSGPDLYTLANWRATSSTNNLVRLPTEPMTKQLLAQANAKYTPDWTLPTFFKVGAKTYVNRFFQTSGTYSWTYVGPSGNRLTADLPVSVYRFFDWTGSNLFADRKVEFPDRQALGAEQQKNPSYFVANPTNATSAANLFPDRSAREYIDAFYAMGQTRLGRLTLQGGVRREDTETRATVVERNVTRPRVGEHDDVFLSGGARYRFTDSLMAVAAFSQSILRADLNSKSAVASINDTAMTGTLPNPDLKPEHANNSSVRLEYYFEPVGVLSAGVFRMDVKDYQYSASGVRAEEIGLGDEYPGYRFSTQANAGSFRIEGYELEYSQQLTFLPGVLRGLGVFGNYSHTRYSDPELAYSRAPETASGGISLRYRRLNSALRWSWTPDTLLTATTFRPSRHMLGLSTSYQLTARTSLFLTGRNLLNAPITAIQRDLPGFLQQKNRYGSNWTFGVKGGF